MTTQHNSFAADTSHRLNAEAFLWLLLSGSSTGYRTPNQVRALLIAAAMQRAARKWAKLA